MSDLAVEALAAAVKYASGSTSNATEVVSVAQQFFGFLANPGAATTTIAAAVTVPPAPDALGAVPLENGQPVAPTVVPDAATSATPTPEPVAADSPAPVSTPEPPA